MFLVLSLRCCLFCSTVQRYGGFLRVVAGTGTWGITGGTFVTHGSTHDSSPLVRPPSRLTLHHSSPLPQKIFAESLQLSEILLIFALDKQYCCS